MQLRLSFLLFLSEIDRRAVQEVICAACETRQPVSNKCTNCDTTFGGYYCSICKFWDDQGEKKKVRDVCVGGRSTLCALADSGSSKESGNAVSLSAGLPLRRVRPLPGRGTRELLSLSNLRQLLPVAAAEQTQVLG